MRRFRAFPIILAALALTSAACVRKVTVPDKLTLAPAVSTEELIRQINSFSEIQTFAANGDLYVRNYFTGKTNKAEDFPGANQLIRLQRPDSIRMQVNAPIIGSKVADMVTDGKQFRLAIFYPGDKRQFVKGTTLGQFERMQAEEILENKDPQLSQAGGLLNMRPQHITDAFLIKSAGENGRTQVFREEVRQDEPDTRSGKKGRTVERAYYVLYVVEAKEDGRGELRRKFWFDRNQGNRLTRQQTFENGVGRLASDISYYDWTPVPASAREWPTRIVIDRRNDGYRLELKLEKDSMEINAGLPDTVFVLENTENLKEVDLDAPRKQINVDVTRKASAAPIKPQSSAFRRPNNE